ncbi:putative truncated L-gulonolactone oxidase 7 mitochondrial [Bienertia sinuspersici]
MMFVSKWCCWFVLITYCLFQWCCMVSCDFVPPEESIKCSSGNSNCTVTNFHRSFADRSVCHVADAVFPTTELDLISAIATATMKNRKMKVATRHSHSFPKLHYSSKWGDIEAVNKGGSKGAVGVASYTLLVGPHRRRDAGNRSPWKLMVAQRKRSYNFTGYPIIGYQNKLQSAGGCLTLGNSLLPSYCPWDPRINGPFFFNVGLNIRTTNLKNFIQDVQKLVKLEPKSLCGVDLYNGILMRYVSASTAYLGNHEDGIDFDITYYRSQDPSSPRMFEDILEEIEQMAVYKYGGTPHWGKNGNVAFDGAINKYKYAGEFLQVKQRYDRFGLFSNEWTDQILGLKEGLTNYKEGCALEGLCICLEDSHCAPNKGYFCLSGRVYKEAKVCRKVKSSNEV